MTLNTLDTIPLDAASSATLRAQLTERRERLRTVLQEERTTPQLIGLLKEVDSALERIETGSYGICEVCHESVEIRYLRAEPLVRVCLGHLSNEQQRAIERDLQLALVSREHHRSAEELAVVCLDDHRDFRSGTSRMDDLTIMILHRSS